jgi:adenine phosphoribosyltransferase
MNFNIDTAIRKVPDFPKKGIIFYDISSIFTNPEAFSWCIEKMADSYSNNKIDAVAAVEARGFLFAAPFAEKMKKPLILIRKKGKLPGRTLSKRFTLEYGHDEIQVHADDIIQGQRILIVDDLIATGGTLKAAAELLAAGGAKVEHIFGVIGLNFLDYKSVLKDYKVKTLINYDNETV